ATCDALRARAGTVERDGMAAIAATVAQNALAPDFADRQAYVDMLLANDPSSYATQCRGLAELDLTEELGRIQAPVVAVSGDLDGVVPPDAARAIAAAIPDCELHLLAGCGHVPPWERPGEVLELVRGVRVGA